ncbi:hypothetical protein ACFSUS_01015 [Spirosoma soli]|uniref:DUF11 domain-containing protein n=1 Tax=Spirosoma soli TaxID=1770529 RepID=A0ABW5LY54_9BACT
MRLFYSVITVFITASSLFAQSFQPYVGIISNSPACDGQTYKLNATYPPPPAGTSVSFQWAGPNNFSSTSYGSIQVLASATTSGTYSVTATYSGNNNAVVSASTVVALGTPKPLAQVSDGQFYNSYGRSICGPTSLTFAAFPDQTYSMNPATYQWTGPNGFTSNLQNPRLNQGTAGQYIVEATYPNGCGIGKDTITVTEFSPSVYVSSYSTGPNQQYSTSFCPGTSAEIRSTVSSLPSGSTVAYRWSGPNGFTSTAQNFTITDITPSMAGTYSVTAMVSGACIGTATASQVISIGAPPPFAYSKPGGSSYNIYCPGIDFSLNVLSVGDGATYQWSGPNGFTSSAQNFTLANATSALGGTYSVTATTAAGCSSSSTVFIKILTPDVYINSSLVGANSFDGSSFCPGTAFQLAAVSGGGVSRTYRWSGPNGFTSADSSVVLNNVTPDMTGVYSVTASYTGACSGTGTSSKTIMIGGPSVTVIRQNLTNSSTCPGGSIGFVASPSASAGTTYMWRGPNGFTSTAQSFTLTNLTAAMSGTYSVTAAFTGACSGTATSSTQLTIGTPRIFINATTNAAVCPGGSLTLTAFSSTGTVATYAWSGPNGFTSSSQSIMLANASPAMAGLYSVTATFTEACAGTSTASRAVEVGQPIANISGNPYVCPGSQLVLTGSQTINLNVVSYPATYRWSGPNGFTSTAQSITITNTSPAMAGMYSLTANLSGVCSGTSAASTQVQVTKPFLNIFSQSADKTSSGSRFCPGTAFVPYPLFFNRSNDFPAASSVTYQWSGPNGFSSTSEQPTVQNATTLASGTYSLTATVTGECSGTYTASTPITIGKPITSVSDFPINAFASGDRVYCAGASVGISAYTSPSSATTSYQWSGPNGFTSSAQSFTLSNLNSTMAGVYSLTTTYSGQCAGQRVAFANIEVGTPQIDIGLFKANGAGGNFARPICPGNLYTLAPTAYLSSQNILLTNNTYEWTLPNGTTTSTPSLTIVSANSSNAGRYILNTTYTGVCSGTSRDTMDVTLGPPTPTLRTERNFIAKGSSTTLYATNCIGSDITWSDGQTGNSIIVSPTQTTPYTAVCNFDGCSGQPSAPLLVTVSDAPETDLSVRMAVTNRAPGVNQPVTVRITVVNSTGQPANNVQITGRLPNSLLANISASSPGWSLQANGQVITAVIASVPASSSTSYTFVVTPTTPGIFRLAAQITASDNPDPDSAPNSGLNDGQDDVAWVDLRTQQFSQVLSESLEPNPAVLPKAQSTLIYLPEGFVDLSLGLVISNKAPQLGEIVTITLLMDNYCNHRLLSPDVTCELPAGLTFVDGDGWSASEQNVLLTGGKYYREWPRTFSFRARVTGSVGAPVKARISRSDWDDVDSAPTNGFDTGEDDTAQVSLRVR